MSLSKIEPAEATAEVEVETLPRLGPGLAGIRLSPEEFDAITDYDDGFRYELI